MSVRVSERLMEITNTIPTNNERVWCVHVAVNYRSIILIRERYSISNGVDIMKWIELYNTLDKSGFVDEYIDLSLKGRLLDKLDFNVGLYELFENTRWIACYVVEGDSEGWYMHISAIVRDDGNKGYREELVILGKFWDYGNAEKCQQLAQRIVNSR